MDSVKIASGLLSIKVTPASRLMHGSQIWFGGEGGKGQEGGKGDGGTGTDGQVLVDWIIASSGIRSPTRLV